MDVKKTRRLLKQCFQPSRANVLWCLLAVGCLIGASYNGYNVLSQFFSQPTATRITTVTKPHLKLPEVAICPFQPLNVSRLREIGMPDHVISFMHWHFTQENWELFGRYFSYDPRTVANVSQYIEGKVWDEFLTENGVQCSQFLEACSFERGKFNCCAVAKPIMNEKRGLCHIFRRLPWPHDQQWPGPNSGLVILMRVPEIDQTTDAGIIEAGVEINYAHKITHPFTTNELGSRSVVYAPPGSSTMIDLRLTEYQRSSAKQVCSDEKSVCRVGCFNKYIQQYCNCSLLGLSEPGKNPTCNPLQGYNCFNMFLGVVNSLTPKCRRENCFPRCYEWKYEAAVSYADLSQDHIRSMLGYPNVPGKYTLVRVFFSTLRYVRMEEFNLITFDNVLSQIGGISGIWLGISMLSTAHAAMHLYKVYKRSSVVEHEPVEKSSF